MTRIGPLEADVLRLLFRMGGSTRHQVEVELNTQGGSSTLTRLETKGLVKREYAWNFFDGDVWTLTDAGTKWVTEIRAPGRGGGY